MTTNTNTTNALDTIKAAALDANNPQAEVYGVLLEHVRIFRNATDSARTHAQRIARAASDLDHNLAAGYNYATDMIGNSREDLQRSLTQRQAAADTIRCLAFALDLDIDGLFAAAVAN